MQTFIFMMNIEFQQCPYLIEKALDKNLHQDANRKHETIPVVVLFNRVITIQISSYKMKNGHKMLKKHKHATYLQIFQVIIHVPFLEAVTCRHKAQRHPAVGAEYGSLDFISLQFAHHTNSPPMRSIRTEILRIALLCLGR